jgi:aminopeptidase C
MKSKNIALSANYLYFYDKLERSNLFLLHMIEMSDVPLGEYALGDPRNCALGSC